MGLDNGIVLVSPQPIEVDNLGVTERDDGLHYEICYWRKCWGLRRAILQVLDPEGINRDEFMFTIEAEDIPALIRAIRPFFNELYWGEEGESIWEFDEMFETLINNVVHLKELEKLLKDNDSLHAYFYDSY